MYKWPCLVITYNPMFLLDFYGSIRLNSIPFFFRPFQLVLSASIQHSDWWLPASSASWSFLWSNVKLYLLFYFNKSPSRASLNFHHSKNMQHSHGTISMLHALLVIPTIIQLIQQEMANLCLSPKKYIHIYSNIFQQKSLSFISFFPKKFSPISELLSYPPGAEIRDHVRKELRRGTAPGPFRCGGRRLRRRHRAQRGRAERGTGDEWTYGWIPKSEFVIFVQHFFLLDVN